MTWMKAIGERAEPILARLQAGDWWDLSADERTALAAWSTMFTMTYEFADLGTQITPPEERLYLMQNSCPPPNWKVWVAEIQVGTVWHAGVTHHKALYAGPASEVKTGNIQTTTFTFGKLLIHTFSTTAKLDFKTTEYGNRLGLQSLWPISSSRIVQPTRPHTNGEAEVVAQILGEALAYFFGGAAL